MFSSFLVLSQQLAMAQEPSNTSDIIIRLGGEVISAEQLGVSQQRFTGKPISMDVLNADIHSLIRSFSAYTDRNFIIGEGVKGKVSVTVEQVPWDQVLTAILSSQGLVAINIGEIIVIQNP